MGIEVLVTEDMRLIEGTGRKLDELVFSCVGFFDLATAFGMIGWIEGVWQEESNTIRNSRGIRLQEEFCKAHFQIDSVSLDFLNFRRIED